MREFVNHVHFVGMGGAGMSGIAEVLLDQGYKVTGSDLGDNQALARLRRRGAEVWIGHDASHVSGADVVVVPERDRVKGDGQGTCAQRVKRARALSQRRLADDSRHFHGHDANIMCARNG